MIQNIMEKQKLYIEGERVSTLETKKNFLVAHIFRDVFSDSQIYSGSLDDLLGETREKVWNFSESEVNERMRIQDEKRLKRFDSFDWYRGNKRFEEMGPWPKMDGLNIRFTTGNIVDTANNISAFEKGELVLDYENDKKKGTDLYNLLEQIKSIQHNKSLIYENFPLILMPGGEIREKKYNRHKKASEPLCKIFSYDIDDGNSRAVSYVLMGLEEAPCYFGVD